MAIPECPVPLLQNEWEFETFLKMYERKAPEVVVEIGSFFGGTLWYWIKMNKNLKKLTSVDYPIGPGDSRYTQMKHCKELWSSWTSHIQFHQIEGDSHNSKVIRDTHKIHQDADTLVDMLFIDGDHSYNGVKMDFEKYKDLVKKGGWIVFHDVVGLPEVKKYWDEIKHRHKYQEIYDGTGGWGIGIIEL